VAPPKPSTWARAARRRPSGCSTPLNANLVRARLFRNAEAALGVYNLLDKHYADPGSVEHRQQLIAQDGRTLRARISYAF
jgi:outer membrane receptor protein involved in Fe transport